MKRLLSGIRNHSRIAVIATIVGTLVVLVGGVGVTFAITNPSEPVALPTMTPTPTATESSIIPITEDSSEVGFGQRYKIAGKTGLAIQWVADGNGQFLFVSWSGSCTDSTQIRFGMPKTSPSPGGNGTVMGDSVFPACNPATHIMQASMGLRAGDAVCAGYNEFWITVSGAPTDNGLHVVPVPAGTVCNVSDQRQGNQQTAPFIDPGKAVPVPSAPPAPPTVSAPIPSGVPTPMNSVPASTSPSP